MKYVHISTGVRVTSNIELPKTLYRLEEETPKKSARKRTTKAVQE